MNAMNTLEQFNRRQAESLAERRAIPEFAPGDTLRVSVRVVEGTRERLQAFEGVCIAKRNRGLNSSFTVRKISYGEGVERIFQTYSVNIAEIQVMRRGDVRRAKLYYLRGLSGKRARIREKQDQRGTRHVLSASVKLTPDGATIEAVGAPSPYDWQAIMATPLAGKVASGTALVQLRRPVDLQLETVRQGMPPGFETESRLRLTPHVDLEGARLHWSVRDWAGRVVCVANEAIALRRDEPVERSFAFKPTDPDPRAYAYWLQAAVRGPAGELVSRAETTLYRYRPYDLGEQLLLATWHTEPASQRRSYSRVFLRHLRELGFNAVFGFRDLDAVERENFRLYAEHQASTRLGVGAANFKQAIEGYPERYQTEGKRRSQRFAVGAGDNAWPTAALNMFSMGEESGYGRWSESYPWRDKEAAPEECNKWFRHYLRTRYRDLAALNQAWGKDFKDWQELKVWRRYAQPYGWMFVAPPAEPERNLTPSVDTHAFHEWYFEEYARNYMRGFNQANPVPSWTLSYDFTFVQFTPSPMSNWYCALPPEGVALWHAYVRPRTPGPANPFHLDWMFFEDEPMNNQFLQMGIALGATYLSTWGHVFNADLTPTRPGITAAKTMRALERPEAAIRKMRPHFDGRVGIYTFDSRWKLVRGRYGYYLHRRGPNDISLGPGPHKAPGASYTRAAEGPLYEALLASGYSPLFMKPEDFSKAKIIFMPYVEAIDRATALALRRFVENGGTLISFPVIAQYDGGGKPYAAYPGAGLDELFGFRAKRQWLMGRYPVDFPGENAARQAFDKVWFRGDDKDNEKPEKEQEAALPLFFKFSMRMGGDPCHYLPEGHEALEALAEDVVVLGRHQDGQPLITYRKVGQGQALCFNVLLTWGSGLANPATEQRETFRQVIDQLVRRFGVEPDFSFQNIRSYGEGINDFTTVQYDLPGANTRILALFSDYRARRADAKLTLHGRYRQVWDVLAGERLVALPNAKGEPESVVVVKPANWRILALTPDEPPAPTLTVAGRAELGRPHALAIGPRGRGAAYGRVEVAAPNGEVMAHHSRSIALKADEELVLRPRLDDPPGAWRVRYTDAVTGKSATAVLPVAAVAGVAARTLPAADAPLTSRVLAARGPEITAGEFLGLLAQLRRCHLAPGPVDKRAYGYYCYELTDSRHRTDQLLAAVDWPGQVQALRRYVAGGERLYLVGEDLGYEPRSGIKCTPARNPRILTALSQLLAGEGSTARLGQLSGRPYLRLIKLGRGLIVLDRRSPDAAGNSNLHLAAFHQQWLVEMKELGLLPGGADPELLPVGGESLEQWFFKGGTLR